MLWQWLGSIPPVPRVTYTANSNQLSYFPTPQIGERLFMKSPLHSFDITCPVAVYIITINVYTHIMYSAIYSTFTLWNGTLVCMDICICVTLRLVRDTFIYILLHYAHPTLTVFIDSVAVQFSRTQDIYKQGNVCF